MRAGISWSITGRSTDMALIGNVFGGAPSPAPAVNRPQQPTYPTGNLAQQEFGSFPQPAPQTGNAFTGSLLGGSRPPAYQNPGISGLPFFPSPVPEPSGLPFQPPVPNDNGLSGLPFQPPPNPELSGLPYMPDMSPLSSLPQNQPQPSGLPFFPSRQPMGSGLQPATRPQNLTMMGGGLFGMRPRGAF